MTRLVVISHDARYSTDLYIIGITHRPTGSLIRSTYSTASSASLLQPYQPLPRPSILGLFISHIVYSLTAFRGHSHSSLSIYSGSYLPEDFSLSSLSSGTVISHTITLLFNNFVFSSHLRVKALPTVIVVTTLQRLRHLLGPSGLFNVKS